MINNNESISLSPLNASAATVAQVGDISNMLQQIDEMLSNGVKIPFTSRTVVDETDIFELLDAIREKLPAEIQQAQQVLQQRDSLLKKTQEECRKHVEQTKEKARQMLQEHEIVRQATRLAEEIRRKADEESRNQRYQADKYSEEVLASLEEKVTQALSTVQSGRRNLSLNMEATARKMGS